MSKENKEEIKENTPSKNKKSSSKTKEKSASKTKATSTKSKSTSKAKATPTKAKKASKAKATSTKSETVSKSKKMPTSSKDNINESDKEKESKNKSDKNKDNKNESGTNTHNKTIGERGEKAAARYLKTKGYEIVAQNWKCKLGEIDLVAIDGEALVFVEVKTRTSIEKGMPEEAVDAKKRKKYECLAAFFLKENDYVDMPVRFDVIAILVVAKDRAMLRHHINAFGIVS